MTAHTDALLLGSPRFDAASPTPDGVEARWQQLIQAEGLQGLARVQGDFAVGLQAADGATWLAVDRFGVQTLCYRVVDGRLRYASRADALADARSEIDPQALFDYLYFHCIPSPRTIYKDVFRLPPGHCARFHQGQLTVQPYWRAQFDAPAGRADFAALRDEFRSLLKQSVQRQLDGSTPACFLSGGTDSSTVAGMIREACGQPAHSYSIGFEAEGYDEMAYARLAAKHFQTVHHEYYVTPDDLVRSIPTVAGHYDQPFGNSSALPAYYCAKVARDNGVTRMLAGDGGDELFGGNARYAKQRVFGWYQHLPAALRSGLMEPLFETGFARRTPLLKKGSSYIEQAKVPMPERLQMYNLLLRLGIGEVLTPQFLAQVDTGAPARHQQSTWRETEGASQLNSTLAFDWRYTLAESDLPKVRETCALAGMAVGFPMLDQALLDFSLKLPDDYKLKGLKLRWFFKEALRGFLPDEILVKKKQGFGLPFGVWLTRHPALMALARDTLHSLAQRRVVRADFIASLFDTHLAQHPGYYGEMVWILMMMEQWLQQHAPSFQIEH